MDLKGPKGIELDKSERSVNVSVSYQKKRTSLSRNVCDNANATRRSHGCECGKTAMENQHNVAAAPEGRDEHLDELTPSTVPHTAALAPSTAEPIAAPATFLSAALFSSLSDRSCGEGKQANTDTQREERITTDEG